MSYMDKKNANSNKLNLIKERTYELSCAFLIKPIRATYADEIDELLVEINTSTGGDLQTVISEERIIAIEYKSELAEDFWPSSIEEIEGEINYLLDNFLKEKDDYKVAKSN